MNVPSKALLSIELFRAFYEYGAGWALSIPLRLISPRGDGHPVMIIPGLGTTDVSTYFIRNFLNNLGYKAYSWGFGRNLGPRNGIPRMAAQLSKRVKQISEECGGQQVSLIGWSLGGIYAREIAKIIPEHIRQVITLASPFKGHAGRTNLTPLYEFLSKDKAHKTEERMRLLAIPPPLPFTSLYSKTDGVVFWRCAIEEEGPISENIEILGASHLGIGHNPAAMYIIAQKLIHTRETWRPYKKN